MDEIQSFFSILNEYLWGVPMVILLFGTHLFLTIRLKFPQRKLFTGIKLSLSKDKSGSGDISQFEALATSLAATIGTGNIIGVATAISLGGPGAVFWCWLTGVLGISTKYAEGILAIKYRKKSENGDMIGGPMCALERGVGSKFLAILFAIFTVLATFGIGSTVQANAVCTTLFDSISLSPYITSSILTILITLVILGGLQSIVKVCVKTVPIMAILYIMGCTYIICLNSAYLGEALNLIFSSAFSMESIGGGAIGGGMMIAARYGIARGLFSNESGLGSSPILAAAARTDNSVRQALVSSTGTFWDTVVLCALTGIMLVSSTLAYPEINIHDSAKITSLAFAKIPYIGTPILVIGITSFCFTTTIGWLCYGEKCFEYLGGRRYLMIYKVIYIISYFVGGIISLNLVWTIADTMNALMAIPNIISLLVLHKVLSSETNKYLWSGKLNEVDKDQIME